MLNTLPEFFQADLQSVNYTLSLFLANYLHGSKLYVPLQPAKEVADCSNNTSKIQAKKYLKI